MGMQRLVITKIKDATVSAVCEELSVRSAQLLSDDTILGNVYVGRVENVSDNIGAAFIEYEKGKKGYYAFSDNQHHIFLNPKNNQRVCQGDLLLVQVTREAVKTKEPTLSSRISISGRLAAVSVRMDDLTESSVFISKKISDEALRSTMKSCVRLCLNRLEKTADWELAARVVQGLKLDIIVRTNAENASMEQLGAEVEKLCSRLCAMLSHANVQSAFTRLYSGDDGCLEDVKNLRGSRLEKIITDLPEVYSTIRDYLLLNEPASVEKLELYDDPTLPLEKLYNLGGQITAALKERVWLPSGGYLVIEPTEALTVIDVNTGKFTGNRKLQKNTYMIINRQAAQEIARQLVLRNLSGIIIVDFINLESPQENKELLAYLSELLRLDPVQATVVGMTRLGLVEITRKKVKKPLHEMFKGILQPSP